MVELNNKSKWNSWQLSFSYYVIHYVIHLCEGSIPGVFVTTVLQLLCDTLCDKSMWRKHSRSFCDDCPAAIMWFTMWYTYVKEAFQEFSWRLSCSYYYDKLCDTPMWRKHSRSFRDDCPVDIMWYTMWYTYMWRKHYKSFRGDCPAAIMWYTFVKEIFYGFSGTTFQNWYPLETIGNK